ncbi:MAG TPA: PilC/PilY family type IV pilus protein [Candidatus Binatia bacterium]|nr:PilC/PilY family type IV pilus protein [Candidatus Binatia bacterium]
MLLLASLIAPRAARALDTDIFTGTGVNPNVIIIFDNSGSMGSQAYNTYPNTIYSGSFDQGTIYSRCKNKNGIAGGDVNSNCTCRNTQSSWVVDQSACADTFEDLIPPPAGDDTDDRESRRKYGNRLDFETNAPKNCIQSPFQACTSNTQCTGMGNQCAAQNKLAVAKGVVTSLINDPDNAKLRLGLVIFNPTGIDYSNANYGSTSWVTSWQVNNGVYKFAAQDSTATSRASLTSIVNGLTANGATPTTHRLIDAWKYLNGQATASGFGTSPVQYTCQRNYFLMVTDGIPEVEADRDVTDQSQCAFTRLQSFVGNPGDLNSDGKENPASPNYLATTGEMYNCGSDYLDDAMYKIRGLFPLNNTQNQPVSLYAVSFGFDYCAPPDPGDTYAGAGSLLWRAAEKYGGGKCLSATEPDELDDALREAFNLIKNDAQSFVAPVVPVSQTNRTVSGDRIYVALFAPRDGAQGWPGNVKKYALNTGSGLICNASTPNCSAGSGSATTSDGTLLSTAESFWDLSSGGPSGVSVTSGGVGGVLVARDLTTRNIYTYLGGGTGNLNSVDITTAGNRFAKTNTAITYSTLGLTGSLGTATDRDELIDYMYGYDVYDGDHDGNITEKRSWVLGDIIHSVPLIVNYSDAPSMIVVGANDGMLHAFDDDTGSELWAFVPPDILPELHKLVPGEATTHPFLVDGSPRLKVVGNQKILVFGLGRGGRAYYALDITSRTAPKLMWRINSATSGFSELGYSTSTPDLKRFASSGTTTEVAVFGGGYDPAFDDPNRSTANTSSPMGRAIFMVDLLTGAKITVSLPGDMTFPVSGDVLTFDVNGDGSFDRGYVGDLGGNLWRIDSGFSIARLFDAPAGLRIFAKPDAVINAGSVMVYFGTGDRTNPMRTDLTDRFYAVRDDGTNDLTEASLVDVTNRVTMPKTEAATQLANEIAAAHGWFIRFSGTGEKVLAAPSVFFNVIFTTFTPSTQACQAGGSARIYVLDPLNGGATLDLAGTSGGGIGGGASTGGGVGSGASGALVVADRSVGIGNSIPTEMKVTFGESSTKAFVGVTKGGGIALQPVNLPQITTNVVPISWRQAW